MGSGDLPSDSKLAVARDALADDEEYMNENSKFPFGENSEGSRKKIESERLNT